jgi:osmoprotectant transport system permease protein
MKRTADQSRRRQRRRTPRAVLLTLVAAALCGPTAAAGQGQAGPSTPNPAPPSTAGERPVRVGSKAFTEGVILGEIATQALRAAGIPAEHRRELGGTRFLWEALRAGEIDVYAEYTGTLREEILGGGAGPGAEGLQSAVAALGAGTSASLGFDDTYAIGMLESTAERLGLRTISDLRRHRELRLGLSHEFLDRPDGWPGLAAHYGLPHREVSGLVHDLAYRALASGEIDVTDLYSTDAEIRQHGLRVLVDDRRFFPEYQALWLYRAELASRQGALLALRRVEGRIDATAMIAMNHRAKVERVPEAQVAADFLAAAGLVSGEVEVAAESRGERLLRTTGEHLALVAVALLAAIGLAVPLGVFAARRPALGQLVLAVTGVLQTVPSMAMLVFMIPLLGIGARPAIAALFLYSLLPIVRNTTTGLADLPQPLRESALALGLPAGARLRRIELPLASRSILAGIKTAAVIAVGTATLGALVGAGGYGQPILTGIRLDDLGLILEGAVPAAVLALLVQWLFDLAELWLVPRGLRLKPS